MKKTIWEKRIPTLIGIIFIMIGIALTSLLVNQGVLFTGRAAPTATPENLRITNISDTSFTVSYRTQAKVLGSLSFGTSKSLGSIATDDRDQQTGNIKNYQVHHITVKDLKPSTKYFFTIVSGNENFSNNNEPFEVTTAEALSAEPSSVKPATGNVVLPDGTKPQEGIVYLTVSEGQTISTLLKSDGSYILPLNSLRKKDLSSYFSFSQETIIQMLIMDPSSQSSLTLLQKQANPVPTITLSKNYDFAANTSSSTPSAELNQATPSAELRFPSLSVSSNVSLEPQILTPQKNQSFSDQQPLFRGTALPEATVKIIINSETPIQEDVIANKSGAWSFRPSQPLSPGQHTISIVTQDRFGIFKTVTQSFTVYAQGTQVDQSATPSATPIPIQAGPTLTLTPTPQATTTPTLTPTPTLIPSPTPTPIVMEEPSTPKGGPQPPGNETVIIGTLIALGTVALGFILFFLTRGSSSL